MTEKILRIEEVSERAGNGYRIVTDKQDILVLIEAGQQCCESWGYMCTNDDTNYFVGTNLLGVSIVDGQYIKYEVGKEASGYAVFVDIETSLGVLQLAVYNDHNGYYGHEVSVKSNQASYSGTI